MPPYTDRLCDIVEQDAQVKKILMPYAKVNFIESKVFLVKVFKRVKGNKRMLIGSIAVINTGLEEPYKFLKFGKEGA